MVEGVKGNGLKSMSNRSSELRQMLASADSQHDHLTTYLKTLLVV